MREASLHRGWLGSLRRLEPLAVGWAALELLERVVPDGAMEDGLLDDAWCYLEALQSAPDRGAAVLLFYAFELRLLERLGLRPALDTCRACGGPPSGMVKLDLTEASWACGRCRPPGSSGWVLPEETVGVLGSLQAQPWGAGDLQAGVRARRSVGVVLHRLLGAHLDRYRYPNALRLLRRPEIRGSKPDPSGFGARSERPRD
jgi:recombinational DNA repair protein (RecF pathway)